MHSMANQNRVAPQEIQKYLGGVNYPATREELANRARENGAPEDVVKFIENLSAERYETPADVMKAYGDEGK